MADLYRYFHDCPRPHSPLTPLPKLAGLLLCLLLGSVSAGAQPPLEAVTLQLKWKHAFQFAGYYAAIEQGYYADAGFEVTLRELTDERSPVDFLLSGEADYAITGSEIVIHRANGAPLVRGETDVFNAYVTDQLFLLNEQGIDGYYILPQLYGVDFYSDILVTTEAYIAADPGRVQAFRDASLKG